MSTYAVSDLHGYYDVFIRGLDRIGFSETDTLYVIGDAIDRGPDGIKTLQYIMAHRNMDLIIGNHEFMMLNSVDPRGYKECNGTDAFLWLNYNGGRATFRKYKSLRLNDRMVLLSWLNHRYVIKTVEINGDTYCLTHSYYKESLENKTYREMKYWDACNIVWSSPYREDAETHADDIYSGFDRIFITGHVPVHSIMKWYEGQIYYNDLKTYRKGNYINIDGGCSFGLQTDLNNGALFLRLDDMTEFPIAIV